MDNSPDIKTEASRPRGLDRVALWAVLALSAVITAGLLVVSVVNVVRIASNTAVNLDLPLDAPLPAEATAGSVTVVEGGMTEATVIAAGLSDQTVGLMTWGAILTWLMYLTVMVVWMVMLVRLLGGRAFARTVRVALLVAAGTIAVVGLAGDTLTNLGTSMAAVELTGNGDPIPFEIRVLPGFVPLVVAIVLAVVAVVVKAGEPMQAEAERLV